MLAGWFHLKYPHLVHGSIASSAPVKAQLDMVGYEDVAANAYTVADNNVGGSVACLAAIKDGHATLGTLFTTLAGRQRLAKLFGMSAVWYMSRANQGQFAGNGVAYFPSQGNDPACTDPACNIAQICKVMTDATLGDNVARLAKLRTLQSEWVAFPAMGAAGNATEVKVASGEPDYWGFQTCAEFGFYQTCEVGSQCMYLQGYVTLASMVAFCQTEFGISVDQVSANINFTNAVYGADKPAGDCIVYANGEVDPWHALSVLKSPSPGVGVLMVPGASHHAWTHPTLPTDQDSVRRAPRAAWLRAVPRPPPPPPPHPTRTHTHTHTHTPHTRAHHHHHHRTCTRALHARAPGCLPRPPRRAFRLAARPRLCGALRTGRGVYLTCECTPLCVYITPPGERGSPDHPRHCRQVPRITLRPGRRRRPALRGVRAAAFVLVQLCGSPTRSLAG